MGGGFLVVCCLGRCMGLGRPGGCVRGRQLAVALASRLCGGGGGGWLCVGVGDTPAAACWVVVGAPACLVRVGVACCRGSGAVRPGCLTCLGLLVCWGLWVGVGGLVVNCIVDASILL